MTPAPTMCRACGSLPAALTVNTGRDERIPEARRALETVVDAGPDALLRYAPKLREALTRP